MRIGDFFPPRSGFVQPVGYLGMVALEKNAN
jgi:hypothetical protein